MGRPINKRYLGTPTATGNQIKVRFHNGTVSADGWIVKQLGARRFRCTDGTNTVDCKLVDKAAAALSANEMSIVVQLDDTTVKQVTKISGRKLTVDTGESVKWNFSDSTTDDVVEMEEAGDDTSFTNADNFE